jgi:hypothetical protein
MRQNQLDQIRNLQLQIAAMEQEIEHLYAERKNLVQESESRLQDLLQTVEEPMNGSGRQSELDRILDIRAELPDYARVACQGVEGSFSHQAADQFFTAPDIQFFEQFEDITNTNYDWGRYCAVSNGGNRAGLWRTLTRDEWNYILVLRKNADKLRARATVNGVAGYVILPDVFAERFEKDGLIDFTTEGEGYEINVYTAEEWAAFEADGAVFFPAGGCRNHDLVYNLGTFGYVWSTTYYGEESAYCFFFSEYYAEELYCTRENGLTVRLVRDFE